MTVIAKENWKKSTIPGLPLTAVLKCPGCKIDVGVGKVHTIAPDGTLSPSMVCPHTAYNGCTFHDSVRLEGWEA